MAHSFGKPTVLLKQRAADVPFDVQGLRFLVYGLTSDGIPQVRAQLERSLQGILGEDRLDEASRLIEMASYRAAVAILGVLLEHELRRAVAHVSIPTSVVRSLSKPPPANEPSREKRQLSEGEFAGPNRVTDIRNRAVQSLEETGAGDARFVLDVVRQFAARGNRF